VVAAVPPSETGSAMSLNQVLRYVGFAVGSALTATVLAGATAGPGAAPSGSGYTTLAVIGTAVCAVTAVVAGLAGRQRPSRPAPGARAAGVPAR
jgi:predicted MFS family arabinose efflux permease